MKHLYMRIVSFFTAIALIVPVIGQYPFQGSIYAYAEIIEESQIFFREDI